MTEVEGDDKPGALLWDRFRFASGRLGVARSGEEVDKTMGGGLSTEESIGEGPGISMSGTPRLDRTSRYVGAGLLDDDEAALLSSPSTKVGVGASIRGIPGPSGGRRSRFRSIGETGGSSFSSCSTLDFESGVNARGGNTKLDCFAVRRSSLREGSGVVRPLEGLRPRVGMAAERFRDGFVSRGSSEGESNAGIRNGSGGGGSP